MLRLLSAVHGVTGGAPAVRRVLDLPAVSRLIGTWLRTTILRHETSGPDDITVVIGVRDRSDYRLANALRSVREQTHVAGSVRAFVVDYGSALEHVHRTRALCQQYQAEHVVVDGAPAWSRSRALNAGIRRTQSAFVMTSDADIVLSPRYLADAVGALRETPESVICSTMWDLPEASVECFRRMADTGEDLQLEQWRARCAPRIRPQFPGFHPSIAVTYTAFYHLIRGYDEYYRVWGAEDDDLMRRFHYLGLRSRVLDSGSFYLHQWHPKYEGVPKGESAEEIAENRAHFRDNHSILRNDLDWGSPTR